VPARSSPKDHMSGRAIGAMEVAGLEPATSSVRSKALAS
jgi:hypothetical protein